MSALIRVGTVATLIAVLAVGCGAEPSAPASEQPSAQTFSVGRHRIRASVPAGWTHHGHGVERQFENGAAQISLIDLGPVTRNGLRREIVASRDLNRRNLHQDAYVKLIDLDLRHVFPDDTEWNGFEERWRTLLGLVDRGESDFARIEGAYEEVLARVESLSIRDLPAIAIAALDRVGHDAMRGIAEQQPLVVDGRDALRIETWDRLSHTMRKSHVFVLHDENLVVLRMGLGRYGDLRPAFDALAVSMELSSDQVPGS